MTFHQDHWTFSGGGGGKLIVWKTGGLLRRTGGVELDGRSWMTHHHYVCCILGDPDHTNESFVLSVTFILVCVRKLINK